MDNENKKIHFSAIPRQFGKKWNHTEEKDAKYVKFGDDNIFPNHTIGLYNKSSIHAACVNAIVEGVVGNGLTANEEIYLAHANNTGETWNDIYAKVALDFKLHGSYALEIIYSVDRTRISEVFHIDFSHIRAREKNHRGYIPGYYISSEWAKKARFRTNVDDDDILYLPVYNPFFKEEQPSQIFVSNHYRPGQEYYPLPDYMGAYKIIEVDIEVDNFHCNNLKNGMVPSLAITTYNNAGDDELRQIQAQLETSYGGTDNAGSIVYMDVASPEMKPDITPIQTTSTDTYYSTINDLVMQKVLTGHRITSGLLLGIKEPGALGGKQEMIDSYTLFQEMVIFPMQKDILTDLEKLLKFNYPDIVLGVENKILFADEESKTEVVTDDATTDAEDANIQQPEILA